MVDTKANFDERGSVVIDALKHESYVATTGVILYGPLHLLDLFDEH